MTILFRTYLILVLVLVQICYPAQTNTIFEPVHNQDSEALEAFLFDPIANFHRIKIIKDLCEHVKRYDLALIGRRKAQESFLDILFDRHFRDIDDEKIDIIIFLFLNLHECIGDIWEKTGKVFSIKPQAFINRIEGTPEWKKIIHTISSNDWETFARGLANLGDTGIEKEVKEYAFSLREEREKKYKAIEAFINDPIVNFDKIKELDDICQSISEYESEFMIQNGVLNTSLLDTLFSTHFMEIDEKKIEVLVFMILHCGGGIYKEMLASRGAALFSQYPNMFVNVLEKTKDWKIFVSQVSLLEWEIFSQGLRKLGDSRFENDIKKFVKEIKKGVEIKSSIFK